ncbi:MAG: hypothetical protein ACE5J5_00625 [Candidatus Hydrothermarchaeales archaeon]
MTETWFLLEDTYQNQGVLEVCNETLFAIEQSISDSEKIWTDEKINLSINECKRFLLDLATAVAAQHTDKNTNAFLFDLGKKLCQKTSKRPEQIIEVIETSIRNLGENPKDIETWKLLNTISEITMKTATQKWDLLKVI